MKCLCPDVYRILCNKTNLHWAAGMIETTVYVHDDARCWLTFAGLRGQCPLFLLLFGSSLFVTICLFLLPWCSLVLFLSSVNLTPVQLKVSSRLSSQASLVSKHTSSSHVSPSSAPSSQSSLFWTRHTIWGPMGETNYHLFSVYFFFFLSSLYSSRSKFSEITQASLCVYGSCETPLLSHCCAEQGMGVEKLSLTHVRISRVDMKKLIWDRLDTVVVWSSTLAVDMDRFFSIQSEEPEDRANVRELVSRVKRDVWRDDGGEASEPSCCLSVSKLSYTVR